MNIPDFFENNNLVQGDDEDMLQGVDSYMFKKVDSAYTKGYLQQTTCNIFQKLYKNHFQNNFSDEQYIESKQSEGNSKHILKLERNYQEDILENYKNKQMNMLLSSSELFPKINSSITDTLKKQRKSDKEEVRYNQRQSHLQSLNEDFRNSQQKFLRNLDDFKTNNNINKETNKQNEIQTYQKNSQNLHDLSINQYEKVEQNIKDYLTKKQENKISIQKKIKKGKVNHLGSLIQNQLQNETAKNAKAQEINRKQKDTNNSSTRRSPKADQTNIQVNESDSEIQFQELQNINDNANTNQFLQGIINSKQLNQPFKISRNVLNQSIQELSPFKNNERNENSILKLQHNALKSNLQYYQQQQNSLSINSSSDNNKQKIQQLNKLSDIQPYENTKGIQNSKENTQNNSELEQQQGMKIQHAIQEIQDLQHICKQSNFSNEEINIQQLPEELKQEGIVINQTFQSIVQDIVFRKFKQNGVNLNEKMENYLNKKSLFQQKCNMLSQNLNQLRSNNHSQLDSNKLDITEQTKEASPEQSGRLNNNIKDTQQDLTKNQNQLGKNEQKQKNQNKNLNDDQNQQQNQQILNSQNGKNQLDQFEKKDINLITIQASPIKQNLIDNYEAKRNQEIIKIFQIQSASSLNNNRNNNDDSISNKQQLVQNDNENLKNQQKEKSKFNNKKNQQTEHIQNFSETNINRIKPETFNEIQQNLNYSFKDIPQPPQSSRPNQINVNYQSPSSNQLKYPPHHPHPQQLHHSPHPQQHHLSPPRPPPQPPTLLSQQYMPYPPHPSASHHIQPSHPQGRPLLLPPNFPPPPLYPHRQYNRQDPYSMNSQNSHRFPPPPLPIYNQSHSFYDNQMYGYPPKQYPYHFLHAPPPAYVSDHSQENKEEQTSKNPKQNKLIISVDEKLDNDQRKQIQFKNGEIIPIDVDVESDSIEILEVNKNPAQIIKN